LLTAVNDWLFFQASDGVSGRELWKTDGTGAERCSSGHQPRRRLVVAGIALWHRERPRVRRLRARHRIRVVEKRRNRTRHVSRSRYRRRTGRAGLREAS
jgi:hypothetical protein